MSKPGMIESRSDFTGGLNVSANPDSMRPNELLACVNARVEPFGGISRRPGSKKLNTTPIPAYIFGVIQWGSQSQLLAFSDGDIYYGSKPYTTLDVYDAAGLLTDFEPTFQPFRVSGGSLVLYLTSNDTLLKWTGSALSVVTTTGATPAAVAAYGTRLFINSQGINGKTVFWSEIGNGDNFTSGGGLSGPGSALVDTLTGDGINGLRVLGGSLLISTNESIARFTGTSDDIQIAQDTQGISADIGPIGDQIYGMPAFKRIEQLVFLYSERGVYIATEGGVMDVGGKIRAPDQTALQITNGTQQDSSGRKIFPIIGHNARRNETWLAYAPVGATKRTHVLVYNPRIQCWSGPFIYTTFGINCFGSFEDSQGIESIMAGCDDGYVRLLDDPTAHPFDDGVQDFDSEVEFAPFFGEVGPQSKKSLEHVFLEVLGQHTFEVTATGDLGVTDQGAFVGDA